MSSMEISKRLKAIADYVPQGSTVADIGSDHAYLPIYLVQTGRALSAIAGEVNQGPWQAAQKQVESAGLSNRIDVRLGDGLSVLQDGEVDTVCIAGMGGALISAILQQGADKLTSVKHLVLQPNMAEIRVRRWLYENGWELKGETILNEDGIIYEVLHASPGDPDAPYQDGPWSREEWFELGPFLWKQQSPCLRKKWEKEREKVSRILSSLQNAKTAEAQEKKKELQARKKWMEEVLKCMQKAKR